MNKSSTENAKKPYNRCLSCPHRKVRCDGPRTAGMPLARWCEYMRDLKELNGLTNAKISEESGVSIKTIERLMAGNADQDIMRDTARRIENVIIGSSNTYPCYLAFEEEQAAKNENEPQLAELMRELERALADNGEYRGILDGIHTSYKAEMEIVRSEAQAKIDFLLTQLAAVRADNERLWAENNRKSKMIDIFIENKPGWLVSEKE